MRVEKASEPDNIRTRVVSIPDEVGSSRERDPSKGFPLVDKQLASQLREHCEALTQQRELSDESDYPCPLAGFRE